VGRSAFDKGPLRVIRLIVIVFLWSCPAHALDRCYTSEEATAERLLRLHSELMVVAVTCRQSSTGADLGRVYSGLTKRNSVAIQKAEKTLINRFSSLYGGDGTERFDRLRTRLANEYGQLVAHESAPVFCARRRDDLAPFYDGKKKMEKSLQPYDASLLDSPPCPATDKRSPAPEKTKKNADH